jgi:hypothetical protein
MDCTNVQTPPRFEQNLIALIAQGIHQLIRILLIQWLSACYLNEIAAVRPHLPQYLIDGLFFAFVKRIFGIAVRASQIAVRQADKHAGSARLGRFSLNTVEYLVYHEHSGIILDYLFVHLPTSTKITL